MSLYQRCGGQGQNGDGTFGAAVTYGTGLRNSSVALGDLNGDGVYEIFSLAEWPGIAPFTDEVGFRGLLTADANGTYSKADYVLPDMFADLVTSDMRIGDVNGDGNINQLDIFQFVALVMSGS